MIGLLAAAALAASSGPAEEAYAMGRGAYLAGFCGRLGWETSEARVTGAAGVWLDSVPDEALDAVSEGVGRGTATGEAEVDAVFGAFEATGDAAALRKAVAAQCDGLAEAMPKLLERTAETDGRLDVEIARLAGNGD